MYIQKKIQNLKKIKGNGVIKSLVIPKLKDSIKIKHTLSISISKREISFKKGKSIFILSDNYAVSELCDFSLFFMDNFLVIELHKGVIYIKDDDKYYSINSKNVVSEYQEDTKKLYFRSFKDIFSDCKEIVSKKYGLILDKEKLEYTNNLIYSIKSSFDYNNGKLYEFKIYSYYSDLSLDLITFEKKEDVPICPPSVLYVDDIYEESKVSNVDRLKRNRNKFLSDMYISPDEDMDDEELPENMHEIDLVKENELEIEDELI